MNVDSIGTWYNIIERFFIHFNLLIDHICVDFLIILIYIKKNNIKHNYQE